MSTNEFCPARFEIPDRIISERQTAICIIDRYQNQYQTALNRYMPVPADMHGALSDLCQKVPKMEVSGAIPTLASKSKCFCTKVFPRQGATTGTKTGTNFVTGA